MQVRFQNSYIYILKENKHKVRYLSRHFDFTEVSNKNGVGVFFHFIMYNRIANIRNFAYYDFKSKLLLIIYDDSERFYKLYDDECLDQIKQIFTNSEVDINDIVKPQNIKLINIKHIINNIEQKHKQLNNVEYGSSYRYLSDKFKYNIRFNFDYEINYKKFTNSIDLKLMDFDDIKGSLLTLFTNIDNVYELNDNHDQILNLLDTTKMPINCFLRNDYTITDVINTNAFIKNIDRKYSNLVLNTSDDDEEFINFKKSINNIIVKTSKKEKVEIKRKTLNVKGFRFYVKEDVSIKCPLFIDIVSMDHRDKLIYCWLKRFDKLGDLNSLIQLSKLEMM